jgi:crossover junction endodeoxyribonuclease RuvC
VKVVGIDPGTAACGYGVVDVCGDRLTWLESGCWTTRAGRGIEERLGRLFELMAALVARREPDVVALEESFVGADARTALSVGQARGAVLVACARAGVRTAEYAPNRIKQAVCGYGHADKHQVQRMVKTLLRLDEVPRPHHAADALAVAICHALTSPLLEMTR